MMKKSFVIVCLLSFFINIASAQYLDWKIEYEILKELSQSKKCLKTAGEIIFILDGSTSVGPDNFNKEKDFAAQVVDKLVIGNNLTRVALITYNNIPLLVFNLDKYNNSQDIKREILKAEFTEGITVVGDALNMVLTDIDKITRKATGKVIILISDGKRNGGMDPILVAKQLKASSYLILTIGLDKETDENAMIAISSKKDFHLIKNFDSLPSIQSALTLKTCTEFHISKCPKRIQTAGICINKQRTDTIKTFYYLNGKCVPEYRKITLKCLNKDECPDPYYQKKLCGSSNHSFILFHNFTNKNGFCSPTTVNLKKYSCGCPNSEEKILRIVHGKECIDGYRKQMLIFYEFTQFKCVETYHNLSPVKCAVLCNGTTLITSQCRNGKRNNTIYAKVFTNNTCSLKLVKTTESHCEETCPKSILIESKVCINNQKDVYHITFDNINGKCIKNTKKVKSVNCTNTTVCPSEKIIKLSCNDGKRNVTKISYRLVGNRCKEEKEPLAIEPCDPFKCPNSTYRVEKCIANAKNTSLISTSYREINRACVKIETPLKQLSCRCYENSLNNITVTVGKECQNGFLSRSLEITEERNNKCEKVSFILRRISCHLRCSRKTRIVVSKCKSNQRVVKVERAAREGEKCVWKSVTSKTVKCKNVCPLPKEKTSRCIRGKQIVSKLIFKEVQDECKVTIIQVNVTRCLRCQRSTYRIDKCEKNDKNTSLIQTFFQRVNGTCVKKEKKVKQLSCRCYENQNKNITVTIGKECQNGFLSRSLEITEERNNKCEKVSFTLRRIRCQLRCSRKTRTVISKCKSNQRVVKVERSSREGQKCVWKSVTSKTVKCKNVCPLTKERKSRCILGKQMISKYIFKELKDECKLNIINVNITKCQGCQNSSYNVKKCEKNIKTTALIRTYYLESNGTCVKNERIIKQLSCRCYANSTNLLTITIGKTCQNGFRARVLELQEERNDKCVKVSLTLRRIRCIVECNKTETKVEPCLNNKQEIRHYKQALTNGICKWNLTATQQVNCSTPCPGPITHTTPCIKGQRFLVRTTFKFIGNKCDKEEQKIQTMKCQKCFKKSIYQVTDCSKDSKQSQLIRISYKNCTRKIDILKNVDCICENINRNGINVTSVTKCINGESYKTVSYFANVNGKCISTDIEIKVGKCGCFGSFYNISICVNGNRTLEKFTKHQSGLTCLTKTVFKRKLRCREICPTKSLFLTKPCSEQKILEVHRIYQQSNQICNVVKYNFRWKNCTTIINNKECKKDTLNVGNCTIGKAPIIYSKYSIKNNQCVEDSKKVDEIVCTDKCVRSIRPTLVAGLCIKNIQRMYFTTSIPQDKKCFHKINFIGKIQCKNC